MSSDFYEPLIERNLAAIPAAARAFASVDDLYLAVARFAVLAYAPSLHSKRTVMACRAAHQLRDACGEQWFDVIIECARYAAESRQPWSEPPFLEPPDPDPSADLRSCDRLAGERWLAAHLDDPDLRQKLESAAGDDALLMIDTAFALIPILGEKGRYALLRMPIWEITSGPQTRTPLDPIETLIDRVITSRGSIESVQAVLLWSAGVPPADQAPSSAPPVYRLARDYAQTLLAHAVAPRLPSRREEFLAAVLHNLEHGESFAEWSFA